MRNCSPRFLRSFTTPRGVRVNVYIDDLTGTVMSSLNFDLLRIVDRQEIHELNRRADERERGWHKKRD